MAKKNLTQRTEGQKACYDGNGNIEWAVRQIYETHSEDAYLALMNVLLERMSEDGEAPTPMVDVNHVLDSWTPENIAVGQTMTLESDMRLAFDTMVDEGGRQWLPLFTDDEELGKGETTNVSLNVPIHTILENGVTSDRVEGVVINPFGQSFSLPKAVLKKLLEFYQEAFEQKKTDN